jgi:hypothetical protein
MHDTKMKFGINISMNIGISINTMNMRTHTSALSFLTWHKKLPKAQSSEGSSGCTLSARLKRIPSAVQTMCRWVCSNAYACTRTYMYAHAYVYVRE